VTRLRANFATGTLTAQLLSDGTSITSPELSKLPVVSDPDYMPIALDPFGEFGAPEIAWVIDHASGATVATITRHEEGTLARLHDVPTVWANTLTAKDFDDLYAAVDSVTDELPSYLPLAGGSMLGPLLLGMDPDDPLEAATKQYVDQLIGTGDFVPLSGGTMTGRLTLSADPTSALHAATKQYADTKATSGHTHSGYAPTTHTHSYSPTNHNHDGDYANPHSHPYASTSHTHSNYVAIGGDNMTGDLTSSAGIHTNTRIRTNASFFAGATIYVENPLTTSDNGQPGWRHLTSAGANGWEFRRLVSSLRYKRHVKQLDHGPLIAELKQAASKLISWEDKGTPTGSPRFIGMSAEDAYEIVPQSVTLNNEGEPEAVDPVNAFGIHLIAAVGDLLNRVEVLEGI
jgi:hypothetical protein